jgi:hypothetical protein
MRSPCREGLVLLTEDAFFSTIPPGFHPDDKRYKKLTILCRGITITSVSGKNRDIEKKQTTLYGAPCKLSVVLSEIEATT